jgi:ribonuclease HII
VRWETSLRRSGFVRIAGTDEVGRGCLAGPVVAAAVVLRPGARIPGLRDSKLLIASKRRSLVRPILLGSEAWGVGAVSPGGIDRHNIRQASLRAMRLAIASLAMRHGGVLPDHVIVDGFRIPGLRIPQTPLIKGDRKCRSVAAASVLAKVVRDRRMDRYHAIYPAYGFDHNRGYGTARHLEALDRFGPCPLHRKSFLPVQLAGQLNLPFPAIAPVLSI